MRRLICTFVVRKLQKRFSHEVALLIMIMFKFLSEEITATLFSLQNNFLSLLLRLKVGHIAEVVWISEGTTCYMSRVMRKPVFAICEQQRRRSACASVQSDQRLCYSLLR